MFHLPKWHYLIFTSKQKNQWRETWSRFPGKFNSSSPSLSKIWAKFWATFHILSHHITSLSSRTFHYNTVIADYITSEQTVKQEKICPVYVFLPHQVYLSLFPLLNPSLIFSTAIFSFILLVGKYFIMTEYNPYMQTWSLTWQKLCTWFLKNFLDKYMKIWKSDFSGLNAS